MKDINQIQNYVNKLQMACQTHSEQSQQQELSETETQKRADHLWDLMAQLYTNKWVKTNGAIANNLWLKAIASLSREQLRLGVNKCEERILYGNQWAPDLAEFMAMIHGQTSVDFQSAFFRCLEKKPQGRVEQWVYENASYNIKRMSHDQAERAHKKYMLEALEREKNGSLLLNAEVMAKALPEKVDRNLNDIKRQEFEESGKRNPLQDRIDKLRKMKR